MCTINIASIENCRIEDGPGIRTTIFFQGCDEKCYNCHNIKTWSLAPVNMMTINDILLEVSKHTPLKKVTISGGEPMVQKKGLLKLLKILKQNKFNIVLYTSYKLSEISTEILSFLDYIKVGKYEDDKKISYEFFGSSNQKFINLKKDYL